MRGEESSIDINMFTVQVEGVRKAGMTVALFATGSELGKQDVLLYCVDCPDISREMILTSCLRFNVSPSLRKEKQRVQN